MWAVLITKMKARAASHLFKNLFRKPRNAIYIQQISQN